MKKLIVHLGLPKTATTTLQHDLFQKLHEQQKINFLGKVVYYNDKTGEGRWINKKGKIIRDACEGKIESITSREIDSILSSELINIFSEEGIMVCYPGMHNLPLKDKIHNLRKILKNYDTRIVITIRNQLDYMYSLYVQLYPDHFCVNKKLNTFEKFANFYLKEKDNELFESMKYEQLLEMLSANFDTKVLLYEDLKYDKEFFFNQISAAFSLDPEDVNLLLDNQHKNQKKKLSTGTVKLNSFKPIEAFSRKIFSKNEYIFNLVKRIYNSKVINLKRIINKRFALPGSVHQKPSKITISKMQNSLGLSKNFNNSKYELSIKKLTEYGYFK
jgi:hypothetical protein